MTPLNQSSLLSEIVLYAGAFAVHAGIVLGSFWAG